MKKIELNKVIKKWYQNQTVHMIGIALVVAMLFGFSQDFHYNTSQAAIQKGLSHSLIRFHVIANSDSQSDQALKLQVRDAVITYMETLLEHSETIDQTRDLIYQHIEDINTISKKVILEYGANYDTQVKLEFENFPLKTYGDIVLPPGEYEALVIKIGKAKGKNWWCVMFPPLCFVDVTHGIVPEASKQELKGVLTESEYNAILRTNTQKKMPVKIKFKFLELFKPKEEESRLFAGTP